MKQVSLWLTALLVLLSVCGAACNRNKKAEQLAALDRGLEAGLLTKDEYETKKAMVLATAATPVAAPAQPVPAMPPPPPSEAAGKPGAEAGAPGAPGGAAPPPVTLTTTPTAPPTRAPANPPPDKLRTRTATKTPALPRQESPAPSKAVSETGPPLRPPAPAQPNPALRGGSSSEEGPEPAPLAGCRDTGSKPGKEKGKQERFFPLPMAKVKDAAIGALEALEFKVGKDSGSEIEASKKRHIGLIGSGGEKVVLRFEPVEGNQRGTLVVGETKKGILGRAGQKSWTEAVLAQTGCMLRVGASGRAGQRRGH